MGNTYTQIHIHAVFTVENRMLLIRCSWREELYRYITGIVQNHNHKLLIINGMPDHIHMLFGMRPTQALSDLMRLVKGESSEWINDKNLVKGRFRWQEGFGAFSYSKSQVSAVTRYIENQETHHRKQTFVEEYRTLLTKFGVEFDNAYVFKPIEYDKESDL